VHHVWSYARRVQADPSKSLVKDIEVPGLSDAPTAYPRMTGVHVAVLAAFLACWGWPSTGPLPRMVPGGTRACFLILGLLAAALAGSRPARWPPLRAGATDLVETALLVGVARGIALVMEDGQILHTIVHALSSPSPPWVPNSPRWGC
jgi:uncharacterized ion transporter superfamily protein YfcC